MDRLRWLAVPGDLTATGRTLREGGEGPRVSGRLVHYLEDHRGTAAYLVAVVGSETAAEIIELSGEPVIALGGYMGWDPTPTLNAFEHLVTSGKVRYVYASSRVGAMLGGTNAAAALEQWVRDHGRLVSPSTALGGWELYDVSDPIVSRSQQRSLATGGLN